MAAITKPSLWNDSESKLRAYICGKLGDDPDSNNWIGEFPEGAYNGWYLEIQGGGEPIDFDVNVDTPGGCGEWGMDGQIVGRFTERENAQYLGNMIRTLMPLAENTIKGIYRCRPRSKPRLNHDYIDRGGNKRIPVWVLTYDLEVILKEQ